MRRTPVTALRLAALLLAVAAAGCNAFGIMGEDDQEVRVTVTALGADFLDADDGFRYQVTAETEYERLAGFSDISVGEVVQIEWEATGNANTRLAREIEADGPEDDD